MDGKSRFENRKVSGENLEKSLIPELREAVEGQLHEREIKNEDLIEVKHGDTRVRILGSLSISGLVVVLCLDLLLRAWKPGYSSPAWMPATLLILALVSLLIVFKK
jgi:hypothetical protein